MKKIQVIIPVILIIFCWNNPIVNAATKPIISNEALDLKTDKKKPDVVSTEIKLNTDVKTDTATNATVLRVMPDIFLNDRNRVVFEQQQKEVQIIDKIRQADLLQPFVANNDSSYQTSMAPQITFTGIKHDKGETVSANDSANKYWSNTNLLMGAGIILLIIGAGFLSVFLGRKYAKSFRRS